MQAIICPKCGFRQNEGAECHRCGIIFSRYNPATTCYVTPVTRNAVVQLPTKTGRQGISVVFTGVPAGLYWRD